MSQKNGEDYSKTPRVRTDHGLSLKYLKINMSPKYAFYISAIFLAAVSFFSFLDALLFLFCYVLGFGIFYFIFKHKEYIFRYFKKIGISKTSHIGSGSHNSSKINCAICGGENCARYEKNSCQEPWVNLLIHKQLDEAIQNFFNAVLQKFITPWYSKITHDDTLLVELKFILRYSSSLLLIRSLKVTLGDLITKKLIPCMIRHYAICSEAKRLMKIKKYRDLEEAALDGPLKHSLHSALYNRECEMEYLRCITEAIMPKLLPKEEVNSKLFSILIREIFSGWVLLSFTDMLADPSIINTLIILATNEEKMSDIPELPKHQVEFLKEFVKNDVYKQMRLLTLELSDILNTPEYLYSFMQFMKSKGKIHLLQFCLDLDDFNKKIIQPEINISEQMSLHRRANELYNLYFLHDSLSYVSFDEQYVKEFKDILDVGYKNILQLQRSKVLFEAYDFIFSLLEGEWAPKFFDSYEFYGMIMPKIAKETKKPIFNIKEKNSSIIGKPFLKLKEAFKSSTIDGQVLNSDDVKYGSEIDLLDAIDLDTMQYSDILANHARLKNKDMSSWTVSIEEVTEKKANNKLAPQFFFNINVNKTDPHGMGDDSTWMVQRTDNDFYTLREKLTEFHGDAILGDLYIPSKKIKAATEIRKMKYEVFLQHLLCIPLLKSSDLLHLFLTTDTNFTMLAKEASTDSSGFVDFENLYQTVTHKLQKERGQHLDSFLQTFLISTDMEYYQNLTEGKKRTFMCEEEATDVMNDVTLTSPVPSAERCLINNVFENNFNIECSVESITILNTETCSWTFAQSFLYILNDVLQIRDLLISISSFVCHFIDVQNYFSGYISDFIHRNLSPPRLGQLIRSGQDLLFNTALHNNEINVENKSEIARNRLKNAFPSSLIQLVGPEFLKNVDILFEFMQHPKLNKQLVYSLLDIVILEIFPELESQYKT